MTEPATQFYKEKIGDKFGPDYENRRWLGTARDRIHYEMNLWALNKHALPLITDLAEKGLELGPGPGTWTEVLLNARPNLSLDLVDISESMLSQAKSKLEGFGGRVRTFTNDIADFDTSEKYQLFFSSRAVEYIPDKEGLIRKIAAILATGGSGYVVTKLPKYGRYKLLRREIPKIHRLQIPPNELRKMCENNGLFVTGIFPVTFVFPIIRSSVLDRLLFLAFRNFKLNPLSAFFAESYAVTFKKI